MKLLIVGGTGRTGRKVAERAVALGHEPVVLGRSATPLTLPSGAVALAGDALEPGVLLEATEGVDAVITALSIPRRSRSPFAPLTGPPDLHHRSTAALLQAMAAQGVERLIKVSAQGVGDSAPRAGLLFRSLVAVSNLRPAFEDHARADALVVDAPLDWTIVRPPVLTDGPPTEHGLEAAEQLRTFTTTRVRTADLAAWIVDALADPTWYRRTVSVRPARAAV